MFESLYPSRRLLAGRHCRLEESTGPSIQRAFADITPERPDAVIVHDIGDLLNQRQLIVELVEKEPLAGDVWLPRVH